MNYITQIEQQNQELQERLAEAETKLALFEKEKDTYATVKLLVTRNGQTQMKVLDSAMLGRFPELLIKAYEELINKG
jgi:hypothetical protein